ncbi:MAG TPA: energy-coupling factor transporter transmembrane component T [Pirellulales bacterium]|nr:energy-coupling factor transporter transmembrane component T [Pirellulales bacterium]
MSYVSSVGASRRTWLAECDPRLKLSWLATVSLASVLVDSRVALLTLCGVALVVAATAGWSTRTWLTVGTALVLVAWGTVLSQAMFYVGEPRTPIVTLVPAFDLGNYRFPGLALFREGAAYGLIQSARMVAVMLAGLTTCLTTSPERLLAALAWLRVPSAISFMTVAALRFLPTLIDQWATVRRSRQLRGYHARLWHIGQGALTSWRTELAILVPVVAAALRRAGMLATALTARGFDAARPRTIYPAIAMTPFERVAVTVLWALSVGLALLKSVYWLSVSGTAEFPALVRWYEFARDWL